MKLQLTKPFLWALRPRFWVVIVTVLAIGLQPQPPQAQATSLFQEDLVEQCAKGVQLFQNDQPSEALSLLEAGFGSWAEAIFADPDDLGQCALTLGLLRHNTGNSPGALDALFVALGAFGNSGNQLFEGTTWNHIGMVHLNQGHLAKALEAYQQALLIFREVDDQASEETILNNIAEVYYAQKRYAEALDAYQQALKIVRNLGDSVGEANTLNNIGMVYYAQERYADALNVYQQALTIAREAGATIDEARTLNNIGRLYQTQEHYDKALATFEQALVMVREADSQADEGAILHNIGFVYQQQDEPKQALASYEQAMARLESGPIVVGSQARQANLTIQQADLYTLTVELYHQQGEDAKAFFTSERSRAWTFDAQSGQQAILEHSTALDLPAIQELIDEQTTLVSYYVLGDKGTLAFVLTRKNFYVIELAEATPENLQSRLTGLYMWPSLENSSPPPALKELHAWLIAPLADYLDTPLVGIIPHQVLHHVPFAALADDERYFIYEHALLTLPSASALPVLLANRHSDIDTNTILALGNPTTNKEGLSPLLYAEKEVRFVADLYEGQALVRLDATESALKSQAGTANILHLATHRANYNPANPLYSTIYLAADAQNDGRLEVGEVYELDLSATNLVVLSSCQTDVLTPYRTDRLSTREDAIEFHQAFMFAGAPNVLHSLWPVDDKATALLMERFYTHLQNGHDEVRALRQSQIELQAEHPELSSPFYWASFVLTGWPENNREELVPAEELLPTLPPPSRWPNLNLSPSSSFLSLLISLVAGVLLSLIATFTNLIRYSGLPALLLLRQRSIAVALGYPDYRRRWNDDSLLTRLIVLLVPPEQMLDAKQVGEELAKLKVSVQEQQIKNELESAVRNGLLLRQAQGYRFAKPELARVLQAHEGSDGRKFLTEQIRDKHPFYINALRFLERANFKLTRISNSLIYRGEPTSPDLERLLPDTVYAQLLPSETLDADQVLNIRKQVKQVDNEATVVFAIIDQRPTDDGWAQIGTLRMSGFKLLPFSNTLINEGLRRGQERTRLRTEIKERLGDDYDPYDVRNPVAGAFSFFGREALVETLWRRIADGRPVGIFGLRKLGKSSLLSALRDRAEFPVAVVNLQSLGRNRLHGLYERILRYWGQWVQARYDELAWHPPTIDKNDPTDEFVAATLDLLEQLKDVQKEARLGIFLDEVEIVVPRRDGSGPSLTHYLRLFRTLRGLVDEDGRVSLVVASLNPAINRINVWDGEQNPTFSLFQEINLPPLTQAHSEQMVRNIGAQIGLVYSEKSLAAIYELSGGHPFLARQLCSLLYSRRKRQAGRIEESEIPATVQRFINDPATGDKLLDQGIWQDAGNAALWDVEGAQANHSLLKDLARADGPMPRDQLIEHQDAKTRRTALLNLERFHIIYQPQPDMIAIRFALLRTWLRQHELELE